jgi:hypothetical protein
MAIAANSDMKLQVLEDLAWVVYPMVHRMEHPWVVHLNMVVVRLYMVVVRLHMVVDQGLRRYLVPTLLKELVGMEQIADSVMSCLLNRWE